MPSHTSSSLNEQNNKMQPMKVFFNVNEEMLSLMKIGQVVQRFLRVTQDRHTTEQFIIRFKIVSPYI